MKALLGAGPDIYMAGSNALYQSCSATDRQSNDDPITHIQRQMYFGALLCGFGFGLVSSRKSMPSVSIGLPGSAN